MTDEGVDETTLKFWGAGGADMEGRGGEKGGERGGGRGEGRGKGGKVSFCAKPQFGDKLTIG